MHNDNGFSGCIFRNRYMKMVNMVLLDGEYDIGDCLVQKIELKFVMNE